MKIISLIERHPKLTWLLEDLLKQSESETINDLKQVFHFARNQLNLIKEYQPKKKNGLMSIPKKL